MHFEIAKDTRAVNVVAVRLRKGVTTPVNAGPRNLSQGTSGADVKELQEVLAKWYPHLNLSVDRVFGPKTANAVRELQRRAGLVVDGIVGPKTREVLGL